MTIGRIVLCAAATGLGVAAGALPLQAQTYPNQQIRLIVPFAAGGITDLLARMAGEHIKAKSGQAVVVENRPGAGGNTGLDQVAKSTPDGYTIGLSGSTTFGVNPHIYKQMPFDPMKDLVPVATIAEAPQILVVNIKKVPAQNLKEFIAFAKANPGKLNVGTIAVGSTQHLAAKLFETVAGIDALVVPYKGSPAVLTALRAGEIDLAFEIAGPMIPQVQAGAVKVLAVSSDKRNPALPDTPTVQQAGVAGYNVASWNALAAPAGTPTEVIAALNRAARDAVAAPSVQDKLGKLGMRLAASSPAEQEALLAGEIKRWGDVIRAAKIEPE